MDRPQRTISDTVVIGGLIAAVIFATVLVFAYQEQYPGEVVQLLRTGFAVLVLATLQRCSYVSLARRLQLDKESREWAAGYAAAAGQRGPGLQRVN